MPEISEVKPEILYCETCNSHFLKGDVCRCPVGSFATWRAWEGAEPAELKDDLMDFTEMDEARDAFLDEVRKCNGADCEAIEGIGHSDACKAEHDAVTECDPNGLDIHAPGAKVDSGKAYVDSILAGFSRALWGVAEVGTFGANKYSLNGWESVEDGERRYREAAARHRLKRQMGELVDADSGLPHEYHEAWNVLAALELRLRDSDERDNS